MLFVNSGLFFRPFLSSIRIHSDAIWGRAIRTDRLRLRRLGIAGPIAGPAGP